MMQAISGAVDRTSRHTSTPLPSGRRTSRMATSGFVAGMRAKASATVPASPTTSMSSLASRRARRPARTTSWSSRRKTPTLIALSCHLRPAAGIPREDLAVGMGKLKSVPFRSIEDPAKLRRVLEATLLIESNLELAEVLRHVVEEARSMTGARFGALGVLTEDKQSLADFITVGLSADEEESIGARPTGRGVLGLLIADPQPLRVREIGSHAKSIGFPPNHPPMGSFLGVPIKLRDEVYGNLYLADKVGWSEFTTDDVALVGALSQAAGIAIENARLHERVRRSAVYEDRDRV